MSACNHLKAATSRHHQKTEGVLVNQILLSSTLSVTNYANCIARYLGLMMPLEQLLLGYPELLSCGYTFRTQWLEEDLFALGWSPQQIKNNPQCHQLPTVDTLAQALGVAYVLQGSQSGGVIIRQRVTVTLGEDVLRDGGLKFWGAQNQTDTANLWQKFKLNMDMYFDPPHNLSLPYATKAARQTFDCFYYWLNLPIEPESEVQSEHSSRI